MSVETGQESHKQLRLTIILSAIIGLICIIAFFYLVTHSPVIKLLKPGTEGLKESVIYKAESLYSQVVPRTPETPDYDREIDVLLDKKVFKYMQYYKKETGSFPDITPATWHITWGEGGIRFDERDPNRYVCKISYDFKGNLTSFHTQRQESGGEAVETSEEDAIWDANFFLETHDIDTELLTITKKDIRKVGSGTTYTFTFQNNSNPFPHFSELYKVEYENGKVTGYDKIVSIDTAAIGWKKREYQGMIAYTAMVIIWLSIILVLLWLFFRKLRRDQLEFKQALMFGILVGTAVFLAMLMESNDSFLARLIGGAIIGGMAFLATLIVFSTSEAVNREVWPNKLQVSDLLFRGRGGVWESGAAMLNTYFITGITLLLFGLLIFAVSHWNLGYLVFSPASLRVFQDLPNAIFIAIKNIAVPLLIGFIFLSFWPAYLKQKTGNRSLVFTLILAFSFVLGGTHLFFFNPPYFSALLVLPIAFFWAYAVHKWDLFTIILSFVWSKFMLDLSLVMVIPGTIFTTQGMIVVVLIILIFVVGMYLLFRSRSASDYDTYVPEYVSRIAERERFLKELEIARGVQMRFLPQQVPQSPNLEIVSLCQPAMEVGGDYFDFIRKDDRYMTVLIGDVSGKGVSAAFYMTMVKGIIKTLSKKILDPATLLVEANEIFYENAPREVFITIIYGIFDLQEKTLTVASAGHNPLIVRRHGSRKTTMVNPRGVAIGLTHGEKYKQLIEEERIEFKGRDTFVFYTDGVSEAMNMDNDIFGEERLLKVVEAYGHLSPQQLQEKIVEAVAEFSGKAPQHDDFTMVVVKIRPQG